MNAYLFSAVAFRSQVRPGPGRAGPADSIQTSETCTNQIVFAPTADAAQSQFEAWLRQQPVGENPVRVKIRKIAAAQFADCLLTESGNTPLNWTEIINQTQAQLESTAVDDFEQGYWVDVNEVVRPNQLSFSAGTLQSDVPEDVRSGLNWSSDRKFFFVLSVLSPLTPPPMDFNEDLNQEESENADSEEPEREEESDLVDPGELYNTFPQALDKDAAALIYARNSVVAAWLWRRYAAETPIATYTIRIDPWCGAINLP
jgi:hypothetical protein